MSNEGFLQQGTVIAGRYEVIKCLGAGSMGLVYACRDRELSGRQIAMKVLFPEVAQDKVAAQRFRNEVFASYDVSHPNVVRAYEYLRDGDIVAYTMEYISGGDLASRLAEPELIPIPEVISILSQMCLGVQAIHDAQIVHRDLKPENIMLSKDGVVKITDFGIARLGHGPKLTEHGGVVGTIDYVSPEYMLNSQVDWRSDIYAIGILGYEMAAGVSPFRGDSVYATMTKRLKTDPDPIANYRPECPPELEKIILHAMEREPDKRFQSAFEMYEELHKIDPNANDEHGSKPHGPIYNPKEEALFIDEENSSVDNSNNSSSYSSEPDDDEKVHSSSAYGEWLMAKAVPDSLSDEPIAAMPSGQHSGNDTETREMAIPRSSVSAPKRASQEVIEIASQYYLEKKDNSMSDQLDCNETIVYQPPQDNDSYGNRLQSFPTPKRASGDIDRSLLERVREREKKEEWRNSTIVLLVVMGFITLFLGIGCGYYIYMKVTGRG